MAITSVRSYLWFALAFVLVLAWGSSHAASVPLYAPSNVSKVGGSFVTAGSAAFNGAAFNSGFTASVAGKSVTVPATWRLASNAGQFAVNAVKVTPGALVGTAVFAWLLPYGLNWVNDHWEKQAPSSIPAPYNHFWGSNQPSGLNTAEDACLALCGNASNCYPKNYPPANIGQYQYCFYRGVAENYPTGWWGYSCPAGYTLAGSVCNATGSLPGSTPTSSDWAAPAAQPLPDSVATELAPKAVPLPLQDPEISPTPIDVPISDPYIDPVTGKRYKDIAQLRPQADQTADVQVIKQEVDANGDPLIDPATSAPKPPEEKQEDECKLNPDRVGCKQLGTPEDAELQTQERGVSFITPQTFGSNATCPPDVQLPRGAKLSWEYPCAMAEGVKPFLIALAWLVAGFIVIGAVRES